MKNILIEAGFTIESTFIPYTEAVERHNFKHLCTNWVCKISLVGRSIEVPYSMGLGLITVNGSKVKVQSSFYRDRTIDEQELTDLGDFKKAKINWENVKIVHGYNSGGIVSSTAGIAPLYEVLETGKLPVDQSTGLITSLSYIKPRVPIDRPSLEDILWHLVSGSDILEFSSFEDWAWSYGYNSDSIEVKSTYDAISIQTSAFLNLLVMQDKITLGELQTLFENY